jgi:outer membrane receptor for ferrienterochelin and colicin
MKIYAITFLFLACAIAAPAQSLKGYVYAVDDTGLSLPLAGANVSIAGTAKGCQTDARGFFRLDGAADENLYLKASYTGYLPDSIRIAEAAAGSVIEFMLLEGVELDEAVVVSNRRGTSLPQLTVRKTELISKTGLMKMACCNLSESFENSATITAGFTDAVSGAKQVQLLGLSGIYSRVTDENVPAMRGLASTYGWNYIPGSWLESIQISKGASSVANGYESITGQINVEHKKPDDTEPLFVNLYVDDAKRVEGNLTSAVRVSGKLWMGLFAHGSMEQEVHDDNGDTFMDTPKTKLINLYNRWLYIDDERGVQSRSGMKFLAEERRGGQDSACHDADGAVLYETRIQNRNLTLYNKTGIALGGREGQSLGVITSYTFHELRSRFGEKHFDGTQNSLYANIVFNSVISPLHKYAAGLSFVYDDYKTDYQDLLPGNNIPSTALNRNEAVAGAFAEYTCSRDDRFIVILGLRGDRSSRYGLLLTPRANVKYSLSDDVVLRASLGRGFHSPNVIAENIGLLASSRKIDVGSIDGLGIEKALNYGANIAVNIPIRDGEKATLSLDFFRTDFQRQTVIDMERERHSVFYYDNAGTSYADTWQADVSATVLNGFDVFAAFRYNKSIVTYSDGSKTYEKEKPLVSRFRGLVNLSYATKLRKWVFDATAQVNGPARIPGMNGYNSEERFSETFPVFFGQVTKNAKRWDIYLGVENLLDYRQKNPIVSPGNPFGEEFDSSLIWGPLMGRRIYAGIRIRLF